MEDIIRLQKEFDRKYGFEKLNSPEDMEGNLQYLLIGLTGEVGEIANDLKKVLRKKYLKGEELPEEFFGKIKGEVIDVFIYLLKLSFLLGIDLKKEHEKRIRRNEEKFADFR